MSIKRIHIMLAEGGGIQNSPSSSKNRLQSSLRRKNSRGGLPIRDTISAKCCSSSRTLSLFARNSRFPSKRSQIYTGISFVTTTKDGNLP
jgi:hypothetical protein